MDGANDEHHELAGERPPALGERAALTGYVPQYLISAALLLRSLTEESLEWVALADPEGGRLDDFQLATPRRIDAYQIKWSAVGGQLPWAPLRGYLSELIVDRRRLAERNPDCQVVGHLYTDRVASNSPITGVKGCRSGASPAAAMGEVLLPMTGAAATAPTTIPAEWAPLWNDLAVAAGVSADELRADFAYVRLDMGRTLPSEADLTGRDALAYRRDVDELALALLRITTDPRRLVRLSRNELLARLGDRWQRRLELSAPHDFPKPLLYESISGTAGELEQAIERFSTGYVALVGTPGSGKSTLLTQELSDREDVVARYYAYVRGRADVGTRRAEASSFLHDLVLTLERGGLPRGPTPVDYDVGLLAARLQRQLGQLGQRFATEGVRSIVVVDGLDHVEREGDLEQPLLRYLPKPDELPEGVLFVVGSQSVGMLKPEIRNQLAQTGRTVEMAGMDRSSVDRIAKAMAISVPIDELWRVTDGHPLVLTYVLEELRGVPASDQASHLVGMPPYAGHVELLYARLWNDVEGDARLVELLGLACRLRGPIDFEWLRQHGEAPEAIRLLRERGAHLFRREPDRWHFFHESFRVYLHDRTAMVAGVASTAEDQRFHRRLAGYCQATSADQPLSWETLFHLSGAGDHEAVLSLATPDFFRRQLLLLRPPELVHDDIRMVARSLALVQDAMAIVRLAIAAGEVTQRSIYAPPRESFWRLLVETGDGRIAVEHMASERERFGDQDGRTARLRLSLLLLDAGLSEEAREIFLTNEPLEVLGGRSTSRHLRSPYQLLYAWACSAAVFRGADAVIAAARELQLRADGDGRDSDEVPTPIARAWMCAAASDELLRRQKPDDADRLAAELDPADAAQRDASLWLTARRWRREAEADVTAESVGDLVTRFEPSDFDPQQRTTIAEALWRMGRREEAVAWITDLVQPHLSNEPGQTAHIWDEEQLRYRLNRLLAANGEWADPQELVPRPDRDVDWGYVHAARITLTIAQLEGRVWAGLPVQADDILRALENVLQILDVASTGDWSVRHTAVGVHAPALARLMSVASKVGRAAVQALWTRYEERWQAEPPLLLREGHRVLVAAVATGVLSPAVLHAWGRKLESLVQASLGGGEAPSELTALADTMLDVGLVDDARRLLRQAAASTLNVAHRKDYQLSSWIDLLGPRLEGDAGAALCRWLAGAIADLREWAEGRQTVDAARQLLLSEGTLRPQRSVCVGRWLEDQGIVEWDDRATTLLEARLSDARDDLWWNVLVDQVAPIAPDPDVGLLRRGAVESTLSRDDVRSRVGELVQRVAVESPPHTRDHWNLAVADCLAAAAIPLIDLGLSDDLHPDRRPPRSRSRGTDEEKRDAFLAAHADVRSLLDAAGCADLTQWQSDWEEAVSLNIDQMSLDDVERAAAIFVSGSSRPGIRVLLARRALTAGAPDVAARLANEVLETAEPRSWLQSWDRGAIVGAFRVLLAIDPVTARDRAYRRFAADGGSDVYVLSEVGRELGDLLDIFGINDREALGAEVEAYLRVLLPAPRGQPDAGTEVATEDARFALAMVAFELLSSPYRLAVTTAQRAMAAAVVKQDDAIQNLLRSVLEGDNEECVLRSLSVLEAAVIQGAQLAEPLRTGVDRWQLADHLGLRLAAQRLGNRIGLAPPNNPTRELPTSFALVVPQQDVPVGAENAEPLGRDDLERTLAAFSTELRLLAESGGVDPGSLNARVAHIARQQAGGQPVDDTRWKTDSSPLGWTFHKPSIRLWEQAAARVAAELLDAGRLEPELALLLSVGQGYDPDLIAVRPIAQPDGVPSLPERNETWIRPDDWMGGVDTSADRLARRLPGDWIVIAERTELRRLDREMPWERRAQAFGVATAVQVRPWFGGSRRTLVSELRTMGPPGDGDPLVQVWDPSFRGPTAWLSVHPTLASACGWERDPGVLIGWRDAGGPTIRSIWWRSGWLDSARWTDRDEVGEGWLVVAQVGAIERMEAVMRGGIRIAWEVERGFLRNRTPSAQRSGTRTPG